MDQLNSLNRYEYLASKWKRKTITQAEEQELLDWLNAADAGEVNVPVSFAGSEEALKSEIYNHVIGRLGLQANESAGVQANESAEIGIGEGPVPTEQPRTVRLWPRIAAAAAAIAVVIFGAGLWYFGDKGISNDGQEIADVRPGKNGATLTLANGKKIYISDNKAGKLADESGVSISKTADGQIVYAVVNQDVQSSNAINTLQTSNGEQTQIRLPDGTVVYLNSASSLRYPASFTKLSKRTVELSGEGYFKVSKDKLHPFVVKTGKQDVEVLGTEFNINSYANEPVIRTTLLEGSVKVSGENNVAKILKPNQQAVNSAKGIEVLDVEAQFFVDWKEGFFMFNNDNLESIMNRLSRWYNVKVVYADPSLKSKTFVGTISKYENISRVIDVLEGTGLATFTINKNIITISIRK